jgi:hypothetical protein
MEKRALKRPLPNHKLGSRFKVGHGACASLVTLIQPDYCYGLAWTVSTKGLGPGGGVASRRSIEILRRKSPHS